MSKDRKKLLGSRLRAARVTANLSQDFTADALGITRQSVSAWETGTSSPTALQLGELSAMYCVCAHALLFGEPYSEVQVEALINGRLRLA